MKREEPRLIPRMEPGRGALVAVRGIMNPSSDVNSEGEGDALGGMMPLLAAASCTSKTCRPPGAESAVKLVQRVSL
jgi:hypothetical protein